MSDAGGRPPTLTPEIAAKIMAALRIGATRPAAAGLAGVSARTMRSWMARTDDVEPFAAFRVAVEQAESVAQTRLSGELFKAALEDPRLACWYLERRWPGEWGRKATAADPDTADADKIDWSAAGEGERPFWEEGCRK